MNKFLTDARSKKIAITIAGISTGLGAAALLISAKAREAERTHPPRGRFITADGVRLHLIERGEGPLVVLLHGNGSMAADFEASGLLNSLSRTFRVMAFDRPGYGFSDRPRNRSWSPTAQAALLCATLKQMGGGRATVIAHSWGTLVALAAALNHPTQIRGLVLLSGYYFPTLRADVAVFSPPAIPVVGDVFRYTLSPLLGALITPALIRKNFAPCAVPPHFYRDFPISLTLRPWHIRASAEEAASMIPAVARLRREYQRINVPVEIIAGAGDRIVNVEKQSVRLFHELPVAKLHVLPGLGHMVHYRAQEQIRQAAMNVSSE